MRAEQFHGNIHHDLPRCIFCTNPRALKGVFCTLGIVFVTALFGFATSVYFGYDMSTLGGFDGGSAVGEKYEYLEQKVGQITSLFGINNSMVEFSGDNPLADAFKAVIKKELGIYDSDKTGLTDYALEKLGGCIISTRDTATYTDGAALLTIFGIPLMSFPSDPKAILQPNVLPGDCWAFEGDRGRVVIKLMTEIIITNISLEHISKNLSPSGDISSAPKDISLYGLCCLDDDKPHYFGSFTYSKSGPTVQTFSVLHPTLRPYSLVEVYFKSNHGHKQFTCVYRVRIHGKLPELEKNEL